jgi:hypothetical protein
MMQNHFFFSRTIKFSMLTAALSILVSINAFGSVIYIPDTYPTIQQGIDAAFPGDTIIVRNGTYYLTSPLDFKGKAITVASEKGPANCILDGKQLTMIAFFHSYETRTSILSGFTIQNGKSARAGGIDCEQSSPTIEQCIIRNNKATGTVADPTGGAGIYCFSSSPLIKNCTISNNTMDASGNNCGGNDCYASGGGIYSKASSPEIIGCNISGNSALNNF